MVAFSIISTQVGAALMHTTFHERTRNLQTAVAKLAAEGQSCEEIAAATGESPETVRLLLGSPAMRDMVAKAEECNG